MCVGGWGTNLYWDPYTHHPYETKDLICKGRVAKSVTGKNPLELREEDRGKKSLPLEEEQKCIPCPELQLG